MATRTGANARGAKVGRREGKVFVSYRREDSDESAGRIRDWLTQPERMPRDDVFMDVHDVAPGVNFVQAVTRAIQACSTMLVVIGPNWLSGHQSLSPYVQEEVAQGLRSNLQVIPVLVRGAVMPDPDALPDQIRDLAYLNASKVRPDDDFEHDMRRLASAIGVRAGSRAGGRRRGRVWAVVAATLILLAGGLTVLSQVPEGNPVWELLHGRLLANASFQDKDADGWDNDNLSCIPQNDGYHLVHNSSCGGPTYGVDRLSTYTISVTTREMGPDATNIYGFLLHYSTAGGYRFLISSTGYVAIYSSPNNTQSRRFFLGAPATSGSVITGIGAINRLEVRVSGSHMAFVVNDFVLAQTNDSEYTGGTVGFTSLHRDRVLTDDPVTDAERQTGDVAFSNLRITAPMFGSQ